MRPVCNLKKIFISLILTSLLFAAGESLAAANEPDITLKVKDRTKRSKDRKEEIKQTSKGGERTTITDSETEICTLVVEVKMNDKPQVDCQMEWYFLSENTKNKEDKGTTVIFSPGKKPLSLKDSVWQEETITSEPFVITTISNDSSNSDDKVSGDEYKGYIVLVTRGGKILAKASNSSRYLSDEWIAKCK